MFRMATIFGAATIVLTLVAACTLKQEPASRTSYDQLEYELNNAKQNLVVLENRNRELDGENKALQQEKTELSQNLIALQQQNAYLQKMNRQLYDNVVRLENELKVKKSVINLQDEVIKLLDDPDNTIASSLKNRINRDTVEVVATDTGFRLIILEKILYDSGSTELNPEGRQLLSLLAQTLKQSSNEQIIVEGHTDNVPLKAGVTVQLHSNWELSAIRAARVVKLLQEEGLKPQNLSARGYGFYRPIGPNDSPEGRQQNRRIEIILSGPN